MTLQDIISREASRLEVKIARACRNKKYPSENLPILEASAGEVAELDYLFASNQEQHIWVYSPAIFEPNGGAQ